MKLLLMIIVPIFFLLVWPWIALWAINVIFGTMLVMTLEKWLAIVAVTLFLKS